MAERKIITRLSVVTDSETPYDNIGDIDGGLFDDKWLKDYIKYYGPNQLIIKLADMSYQIINTSREIDKRKRRIYKN